MRPRFTFLFLLLIAAPLVLMAWIGAMLLRQQQSQALSAWRAVIDGKLRSAELLLAQEMIRLENDFDLLLKDVALDEASLLGLPHDQPLVRQAFLLDARGRMIFPSRQGGAQGETAAFFKRTESIWETGVRFGSEALLAKNESQTLAPSVAQKPAVQKKMMRQDYQAGQSVQNTYSKNPDVRPSVKVSGKTGTPEPVIAASGWHVWFYGNGPQMIFWQERADRLVTGIEVEMNALLSLLVNRLSSADAPRAAGLMQLTSADGKTVLHQWGAAGEDKVAAPVAQRNCAVPLGMWQLVYRPGKTEAPRTQRAPVLLGLGGAALALVSVALLFLRESTRDMREAKRRVSFVNQVSHELKTPLTNIRLYAEMAHQRVEELDDASASRHLSVVEAETSRLSRLIHNVLTFGQQQRDQLAIHPRTASLDEVTRRVTGVWRPGLEAKGFAVECLLDAPDPFMFDPDALEQIIGNLLSNVEKYAGGGRYVKIATQADGKNVRLTIEDRGPGIPARMRATVFAPFVRVRNDVTEGVSGTGIGLSISRNLAELHGGSLTLEDVPGGGSRFVLTLPIKQNFGGGPPSS